MMIENFDTKNLAVLRGEMQAALNEIAAKHGIKLQLKNISYDPVTATFRVPLEGQAGAAETKAREQALSMARMLDDVDASQPSEHARAKGAVLVEYMGRRSKPWCYELNGKRYVTTDDGLKVMWPKVVEDSPV